MNRCLEHIKNWASQDHEGLSVKQLADAVVRMCNDAIEETCIWIYNQFDDYWDTDCGEAFTLLNGTPGDNGMQFCPYCGRHVDVEELAQCDDEEDLPFTDVSIQEEIKHEQETNNRA